MGTTGQSQMLLTEEEKKKKKADDIRARSEGPTWKGNVRVNQDGSLYRDPNGQQYGQERIEIANEDTLKAEEAAIEQDKRQAKFIEESTVTRDLEAQKQKDRRKQASGRRGTILTGRSGLGGYAGGSGKTILGM